MASLSFKATPGLLSRGTLPTSLVDSVITSLPSPHTRASYAKGIADLYAFAEGRPITLVLLQEWRMTMAGRVSTATVNARITAARRLIKEARRTNRITSDEAFDLLQIEGLPFRGDRTGNWLTVAQLRRLLAVPTGPHLRSRRNYCILALLAGCAIRLNELATLDMETLQERDGRWVLADLMGKGGRVRTVAVPAWVRIAIRHWTQAAKITEGRLIRPLTLAPTGLSAEGIRTIVRRAAEKIGVHDFSPHDLRRTCARLCREQGGDLEQIQFMLGHASLVTTQRYLGTVQDLRHAVNDKMGL